MKKLIVMAVAMVLLLSLSGIAKYPAGKSPRRSSSLLDTKTWIDANQILMMQTNKGSFAYDQGAFLGKNDGLYFPFISLEKILDGSQSLSVYFAAGVWISGVDTALGETLATVAEYSDEFTPGPAGTSQAQAVSDGTLKVYKLYSDSLKNNPNSDYLNWPVSMGAPVDVNGEPDGIMLGDQMLWSVYNDAEPLNHTNNATGPIGLGVEIRQTTFAFSREGALSNMVFLRYRIYNPVGGRNLDSVYVTLWADPDLGNASDDLVGCDTILSLGYVYNGFADDANYGSTAPAGGFDFFQGPLVPGDSILDTAIAWDFQRFPGMKNLGMTGFAEYPNGKDPASSAETYHYMQGKEPNGTPIIDINGNVTTYEWSGDPVNGTGFLDSNPSDRRYMVNTGPFPLAAGDSTEIVAAVILGRGKSALASITTMKTIDAFAQGVYDKGFQLPKPPAPPDVTVTSADNEVFFKWGTASEDDPGDYPFEGYTVIQGTSAVGPWTDTLGWHDITNGVLGIKDLRFEVSLGAEIEYLAKPGTDEGLKHFFRSTRDVTGGGNIVNYTEYFYRVEAYSFDTTQPSGFKTLTSATIVTTLPEPVNPGISLNNMFNDALVVGHTGGSDGSVTAQIVDAEALNGHSFDVRFNDDTNYVVVIDSIDLSMSPPDTILDTLEIVPPPTWNLIDVTSGDTLSLNQTNQTGDDNYIVTDGIVARVSGPPLLGKSHNYASSNPPNGSPWARPGYVPGTDNRWYTAGTQASGGELLFGGIFMEPNFWGATTLTGADYATVEIRWRPIATFTDLTGDGAYTPGEPYVVDSVNLTQKAFMYQTFNGGAYEGFFDIPFTAWDVTDTANPRQLNVVIRDRDADFAWNLSDDLGDPLLPNGGDQRFNYTWILSTDYDATGTMYGDGTGGSLDFFAAQGGNAVYDGMWVLWLGERGSSRGQLAEGCITTLTPNFVNTAADTFSFSSTPPTVRTSGTVADLSNIKTVPNPYNLSSTYDNSNFNRRLRFTNLPNVATIKIYNLAGELVSTVVKNDPSTDAFWDMENDFGIPIGSGIYIYVVDAPGFGQKIGKTAIFVETELLDQF